MSISLMSLVWSRFPRGGSEKLMLLALADWANDQGASLYPSISTIARKCCLKECQARRIMHKLITDGLLEVVSNANGGPPGRTRRYRLNLLSLRAGVPNATPVLQAQEGCTPVPRRAVLEESQSTINPLDNRQRRAREFVDVCKANGVKGAAAGPEIEKWLTEGVTIEVVRQAIARARRRKPVPETIPIKYLLPIVAELREVKVAVASIRWGAGGEPTDILVKAAATLQLDPWNTKSGETFGQFRNRIVEAGGEAMLRPPKTVATKE